MRIHYLQHSIFEGPGTLRELAEEGGHSLTGTKTYQSTEFPDHGDYDLLVILGGPMGVRDETSFPWLVEEKRFIREADKNTKKILGICLGAQLLADLKGARVHRGEREVGWFPVKTTTYAAQSAFFSSFPPEFTPFHWHDDTFTNPPGALRMVGTVRTPNQAFEIDGRIVGLQFHLETNPELIASFVEANEETWPEGKAVQTSRDIVAQSSHFRQSRALMGRILSTFAGKAKRHSRVVVKKRGPR